MKQQEVRRVNIGENNFYIRPLPALRAANLTGELGALVIPLLSGLAPFLEAVGRKDGEDKVEAAKSTDKTDPAPGLLDIDIKDAAPAVAGAFSALSGDKIESILRHLLITGGNIAIEPPGEKAHTLDEDTLNEVFCTDVQDMFILAFEVIRTNYGGFFKKLGDQFGQAIGGLVQKVTPRQENTAHLT